MITEVSEINIKEAAKVYMDSWKESHKEICSAKFIEKHDTDYMINYLSEKIKSGYKIFINFIDEKPVGIIGINPFDEEICLLYVAPKEQGKGFGSKLLNFALERCENPYITVLDTNKKAIDFYLKRGFVPDKNQNENDEENRIFERKYVYQKQNL